MNGLGWKRTKDKSDESVRLRWCEVKSGINYSSFREGEESYQFRVFSFQASVNVYIDLTCHGEFWHLIENIYGVNDVLNK